jgi:hypothetical protein
LSELFFNIESLSEFLINQPERVAGADHIEPASDSDFDRLLERSLLEKKLLQKKLDNNDYGTDLSSAADIRSDWNAEQTNTPNYSEFAERQLSSVSITKEAKPPTEVDAGVESYTPDSMTISDIKKLLADKPLLVALDLNKADGGIMVTMLQNRMSSLMKFEAGIVAQSTNAFAVDFDGLTGSEVPGAKSLNLNSGQVQQVNNTNNNGNIGIDGSSNLNMQGILSDRISPADGNNIFDTPNSLRVIFDFNRLLDSFSQKVSIKIADGNNNSVDKTVPLSLLRELVEKYPGKLLVEIKAGNLLNQNKPTSTESTSLAHDRQGKNGGKYAEILSCQKASADTDRANNKSIILDLKSLLDKNDAREINVIQKTGISKNYFDSRLLSSGLKNSIGMEYARIAGLNSAGNWLSKSFPTGLFAQPTGQTAGMNNDIVGSLTEREQTKGNDLKIQNDQAKGDKNGKQFLTSSGDSLSPRSQATGMKDPKLIIDNLNVKQSSVIRTANPGSDSKVEELLADKCTLPEAISRVENIIQQLRSRFVANPENTQMILKLKPESLGNLRINLRYDGHRLEALFRVENPEARQILEAELPKMRAEWKIDSLKIEMNNLAHQENPAHSQQHPARTSGGKYQPVGEHPLRPDDSLDEETAIRNANRHKSNLYGGEIDIIV